MTGQRTVIIGLGVTGYSCLRHLHGTDDLVVLDSRQQPPFAADAAAYHGDVQLALGVTEFDFRGYDRVVVSPGVALDHPLVRAAQLAGLERLSDMDLFFDAVQAPVIGVTGTNGKSTVTTLIGHLLTDAGRRAATGGNLGQAALDLLTLEGVDCFVLELSSFQLERLTPRHLTAAAVLNLSDDHMDRYASLEEYAATKRRIFADCDLAVANRDDPLTQPRTPVRRLITFGADAPQAGHWGVAQAQDERWIMRGDEPVMRCAELPLAGRHNEANVMAAFALLDAFELPLDVLASGVRGFQGLAHRCQRIAEIDGVSFVDDSKATNVGATQAALHGLGGDRLVLIAGGQGKGADFRALREQVQRHVRVLVLLGEDAGKLEDALGDLVAVHRVRDMRQAVRTARDLAEPGDTVLLSPACASLDMYDNFAARGEAFALAVQELAR